MNDIDKGEQGARMTQCLPKQFLGNNVTEDSRFSNGKCNLFRIRNKVLIPFSESRKCLYNSGDYYPKNKGRPLIKHRMPPTIVTYFTYSEISGTPRPTIEVFRSELRKFSRNETVYACALLNAVLKNWVGDFDENSHVLLVRDSLPPDVANYVISQFRGGDQTRGLYHRQQLLFVAKEAVQVCPTVGRNPLSLPYWGGLGIILLMANDLLPKRIVTNATVSEQVLNVLAEMIPVAEASGFYQPVNKMVRGFAMLNDFLNDSEIDVATIFESATGITINKYQALTFASMTRYSDFSFNKFRQAPSDFLIGLNWFRTLLIDESVVRAYLKDVSADAEELASCFSQRNRGTNDFTCFRDRPLFRDGEINFLLDSAFLAEKAEAAPFWRVLQSLPNELKNRFHAIWGTAFERYINWLIEQSVDGLKNRLVKNPIFERSNEEVCDSILFCDNAAIFIECKGATFTAEAKYGDDPSTLQAEIDSKLVNKKGVGQLVRSIEQVFNRRFPRPIAGVDVSGITRVVPVLITRDDIGAALVMNRYLADRFREQCHRKSVSVTVTPLFSLSAQDIENICGYLPDVSLLELLEERYRNDPGLISTFWAVPNRIVDALGNRKPKAFSEQFRRFSQMVQQELPMTTEATGTPSPDDQSNRDEVERD